MSLAPLRVALGSENPRLVSSVLAWFDDDEQLPFRVLTRPCTVVRLCGSVRDLRAAVASDAVDIVVVSSGLNAIPFGELRGLAEAARGRVVVLASDRPSSRWAGFPAAVLDAEPDRAGLAAALEEALVGRPKAGHEPPSGSTEPSRTAVAEAARPEPASGGGRLIAVSGPNAPHGASTIAAALAFAAGVTVRTALCDLDTRGSVQEFHVGADPTLNACLLARREPRSAAEWTSALRSEMQPMGAPSRAELLCGVTRPPLREHLTPTFLESLFAALRARYQLTFVDTSGAGWVPGDAELDRRILAAADQVLLVVRPDEQGVARAQRVLRRWPHPERVSVILNLAGLPGSERPDAVESTLRVPIAAVIPVDVRGVATARARHRPIVCQPGCRASKPLLELAGRLAGGGPLTLPVDEVPSHRQWWRRLALPLARLSR